MKRFLGSWLLFLILGGVLIYFQKDQGWLGFLGHLPGDMVLRREGRVLFLPLSSSFFVTLILSLLSSCFQKK